jgi:hypothetical protein
MKSAKHFKEWMEKTQQEARQQDAQFRRRQVAGMAAGQSREALLALLGVLADQMPPMTAEAGYWYTLGFLEATVGTYKSPDKSSDAQEDA